MKKIVLISDNHSYYGDEVTDHLLDVDEIWHAGDIGDLSSIEKYRQLAFFRGVYGNIDDQSVRDIFPLNEIFICEGIKVFMTHIGGYPGQVCIQSVSNNKKRKNRIFIFAAIHISAR